MLERTAPIRGAGGFYRTAEGESGTTGGIPLANVDAAVVAAVRLAYDVAEAQVERSTRLARRLRDAGDKEVGPDSAAKAVDASEKLVMNAVMSGLEWWETSVASGRCPVKRLAAAEYQMIGTILGLKPLHPPGDAGAATERDPSLSVPRDAGMSRPKLRVRHGGDPHRRRPVKLIVVDIDIGLELAASPIWFQSSDDRRPFEAQLTVSEAGAELWLQTPEIEPGQWSALICDANDVQRGVIELEL